MLRGLLIHQSPIDILSPPWNDASFITPCHAARGHWNHAPLRKACLEGGQWFLVGHAEAEDTIKKRPPSLVERSALAQRSAGDGQRKHKDLPETIKLVITRMKVTVTGNVVADLDITNGARGTIVDVRSIYHSVLVKLNRSRLPEFSLGLDDE